MPDHLDLQKQEALNILGSMENPPKVEAPVTVFDTSKSSEGILLNSLPTELRDILAPFDKVNAQGFKDGIIDMQELAAVHV